MKVDSSILRKLIRLKSWFEPLILRLQPCDFPVSASDTGAELLTLPSATRGHLSL
jgi:hypothetical protein